MYFCRKLLPFSLALLVCCARVPASAQATKQDRVPMWQEARRSAAKGTRITVPPPILRELTADPEDCPQPSPGETTKMDAYRVRSGHQSLVAVWGRGSCFCSPTGNCAFWVYRHRLGKYEKILDTDMVREFGFLESGARGYRDLVTWAHDSADRAPAFVYRFNGTKYEALCSWEEHYQYRELPDGKWVLAGGPQIVGNTCGTDAKER